MAEIQYVALDEFHARYQNGRGEQRKGQAMMNALGTVSPLLYDMVF